ncbi:MAG: hypothetical protein WA985_02795 [Erythrobacter sp.]
MTAPTSPPPHDIAGELGAAMEWWRMSGVDCDFHDDATDWLEEERVADPVREAAELPSAPARNPAALHEARRNLRTSEQPRIDLFGDAVPQSLEEFSRWWLEAPGLDTIGPRGRVAPRGAAKAELMVLVVDPEDSDRERLLDGARGRLLKNMLSAIGLTEDRIYLASALTRHTPMADTRAIAAGGMDRVVARHIELASPHRLLAFGTDILPLLGLDATEADGSMRSTTLEWHSIPLLLSEGLEPMMAMPKLKARFWRRYMEWTQAE